MGLFKIIDITYKNGTTRTDDKYPQRIGSIVEMKYLETGKPMYLNYIENNHGEKKDGVLRTSTIEGIRYIDDGNMYIVTTLNSVYYLRDVI